MNSFRVKITHLTLTSNTIFILHVVECTIGRFNPSYCSIDIGILWIKHVNVTLNYNMSLIMCNAILTIVVEHDWCPLTNHCDAMICIPMHISTLITNARTTSSDSGRKRIKSPLVFLFIMLCCWILSHWNSIQKESWWVFHLLDWSSLRESIIKSDE